MSFSKAVRVVVPIAALVLLGLLPALLAGGGEKRVPKVDAGPLMAAPGPEEVESLNSLERYSHARVTYPTGRFDGRWLLEAAKQDAKIASAIPAGERPLAARTAPEALSSSTFTSLGPQPQESTGCQPPCFTFGFVSGRVNAIAIDHSTTTPGAIVAYIGVDGGGIWKSTNCCTPATTWAPVTDKRGSDPNSINSIAIDDIAIDPNNANVVYAATGDISFGSFAFGSAGVLKSTDKGANWSVKGADVFGPVYSQPEGAYPQYQVVSTINVDPNNSNTVVAGTKTGLFFSYDAGENWTGPCFTNGFSDQRQDITDLLLVDTGTAATKNEPTVMLAAVGARGFATTVQFNLGRNGANGVYRTDVPTTGCPASWQALTSGWPSGTAAGVGCDPPIGNNSELCEANENKLGRIEMAVAPSTVGNPAGAGGDRSFTVYAEVQAVDPQTPCGVLTTATGGTARGCFLGLWRSADGGNTWEQRSDKNDLHPVTNPAAGPCGEDTPQNWYNQGLAVDPMNPDALFMDAIDIWKSTDGGTTLTDISCGYYTGLNPIGAPVHVDNHALAYVPGNPTTLLAGNDGGIYVSNNAANVPVGTPTTVANPPTFVDINKTVSTIEFYSGDISANFGTTTGNAFIVGGAQDNGSSFAQFPAGVSCPATGCQWSQRIGGDGMYARIEPKSGQRVYMESQVGNLQRSQSGPAGPYLNYTDPWEANDVPRLSFVFPYEIDKHDCRTFQRVVEETCNHLIAGSYRVYESITGGLTSSAWYVNSPDLTKPGRPLGDRSFINQLAYSMLDNRVAIVGTNDGNVQYGFDLGQGTVNTAKWVNVTGSNIVLPNRPILDVVISPDPAHNSRVGYAAVGGFDQNTPGTPGHVFQVTCTADCATFTWANKTGNLPNIPVDSIMANPRFPQQVFAGTDWGLYFTNDVNAATPQWFRFDAGLPHVMIWDMVVDRGPDTSTTAGRATTLAVFTRARGAYAWLLPSGPIAPTAVGVTRFTGKATSAGVTVSWRTTAETAAIGYNVWRFAGGKGVKVNRTLVAAKAAGRATGASYRLVDRTARRGVAYTYRLRVVTRSGSRSWVASTTVRARR